MNNAEFAKLQERSLSHQARSLYLFFIRPRAERGIFTAPLGEVTAFLQNNSPVCPFSPVPEQSAQILQELYRCGLLADPDPMQAQQRRQYRLPLVEAEQAELPAMPFHMHSAWRPSTGFAQTALLAGLPDGNFTESELNSFISYWQHRPEQRNQHAWERAFAQRLLKRRQAASGTRAASPAAVFTAAQKHLAAAPALTAAAAPKLQADILPQSTDRHAARSMSGTGVQLFAPGTFDPLKAHRSGPASEMTSASEPHHKKDATGPHFTAASLKSALQAAGLAPTTASDSAAEKTNSSNTQGEKS